MLVYKIDVELTEPACDLERKEKTERAGVIQSKAEVLCYIRQRAAELIEIIGA